MGAAGPAGRGLSGAAGGRRQAQLAACWAGVSNWRSGWLPIGDAVTGRAGPQMQMRRCGACGARQTPVKAWLARLLLHLAPIIVLDTPDSASRRHAEAATLTLRAESAFRGAPAITRQSTAFTSRFARLWRCSCDGLPPAPLPPPLATRAALLALKLQGLGWRSAARPDRSVDIEHAPEAESSPWKMGYQVPLVLRSVHHAVGGSLRPTASLPLIFISFLALLPTFLDPLRCR